MQRVFYTKRFINSTIHTFNLRNNFPQIFLYTTSSSSSSSSSLYSSSSDNFTDYLVNSLGFSHQQAITTSTKLSNYNQVNHSNLFENANSVVNLLKNEGFNDTHITKMVSIYPKLLTYDAHSTIKPKLNLLIDEGISGIDLIDIVTVSPWILGSDKISVILSATKLIQQILVFDEHVIACMKNLLFRHFSSVITYLSPNVTFLTSYGVPIESIRKHLVWQPLTFLRNPDEFKDIVVKVEKKLQKPPDSAMFLYGVYLFMYTSEENIESKCRVFKSFGWTQSDVNTLMSKNARCFTLSDENIKKKLEFLMNDLGLEPAQLASKVCFLTYSLEKRTLPRHKVLEVLKEKELLKKCPRFSSVLVSTESHFVKMFVLPFEEVHQVYADHIGCSVESLTQE